MRQAEVMKHEGHDKEAAANLADASEDAAITAFLSEMDGIFPLKEEEREEFYWRLFSGKIDVFTLLSTGHGLSIP